MPSPGEPDQVESKPDAADEAAPPSLPASDNRPEGAPEVTRSRVDARDLTAPPALPMAALVGWLLLLASVFGRALAPALPGARAGFERWITWGDRFGAVFSQAALLVGTVTTVVLLLTNLKQNGLGIVYRLLMAVFGAGTLTVVMTAHRHRIRADSVLVVALVTSILAFWSSLPALRTPRSRGAALVLLAAGLSALTHTVARALAIYASDNALVSLFGVARGVATIGMLFDVGALVLSVLWLWVPKPRVGATVLAVGTLLSVLLVGAAASGSAPDASLFAVIADRALTELTQHPAPLVPQTVRAGIEVLAFALAAGALLQGAERKLSGVVIALAILARGSTDIPLCAMSLLLAALLAPLAAVPHGDKSSELALEPRANRG
ncbi:MAG: hypothetical protein H6718_24035 [Polyangiaceae bacterium]|nr:hypothetical protein [Polyangiaceae bacterium]